MPRPTYKSPVRPRLQYDDLLALPREEFFDLLNSVDLTLLSNTVERKAPERVKQVPVIAPLRTPVRNPLTSPLRRRGQ